MTGGWLKVTGFIGVRGEVVVVVVNGGAGERGASVGVKGGVGVEKAEVWVMDGGRVWRGGWWRWRGGGRWGACRGGGW